MTYFLSINKSFSHFFFILSGDYEAAISEHQQELALSEALNDVIGRAVANRKIGECYAEMGNIEAALKVSRSNPFEWWFMFLDFLKFYMDFYLF